MTSTADSAAQPMTDPEVEPSPGLTWELVHAEPGSLTYAVPGIRPGRPAGEGLSRWAPGGVADVAGGPATHRPEEHPALHYAGYIGRVGVLAAALGVGAAMAGNQGIAWAEPTESDSSSSSSSGTEAQSPRQRNPRRSPSSQSPASPTTRPTRRPGQTTTDRSGLDLGSPSRRAGARDATTVAPLPSTTVDAPQPAVPTPVNEAPPTAAPRTGVASPVTSPTAAPTTPARPTVEPRAPRPPQRIPLPSTAQTQAEALPSPVPVQNAPTDGVPAPPAPPARGAARSDTLDRIVGAVLEPLSTPNSPAVRTVESTASWSLLAWVRRTFFNESPTLAFNPTQSTQVDDIVTGTLNPHDPDGDTLTYTATPPINGGSVSVAPDGTFTYTPTDELATTGGTDTFEVTVSDAGNGFHLHGMRGMLNLLTFGLIGDGGHGATTTVTVDVNVAPVSAVPPYSLGTPDHSTGAVPGEMHVTDADSDALSYFVTGGPADGTVSLATDGTFTYTPTPTARHEAAAEGAGAADLADSFIVTVDDNHGKTIEVPVTVAIDPTNAAPTITAVTVSDPESDGTVTVTVTVTDPDTDPITYMVIHDPSYGTVAPAPGGFTYTPTTAARHDAAGTPGIDTDTFQIMASDLHHGIDTTAATVVVSPANVAPSGLAQSVNIPDPVTGVVTGTVTGTDADGDTLTFSGTTGTAKGAVIVDPDGTFTYTPTDTARHNAAADAAASTDKQDSFTVTASDGRGGITPVAVTVVISPANQMPTATVTPTPGTGNTWTVGVSTSDPDNDTVTTTLTPTDPTHVTVTGDTVTVTDTDWAAANPGEQISVIVTANDGHGGTVSTVVPVGTVSNATAVGYNGNGQTNIPALPAGAAYTDVAAGYSHTVLLRSDGTAVGIGANPTIPALPPDTTYTDVAAGYYHTVLLRSDGTAVAVGSNDYGQTTIPALPPDTTYTDVAAGGSHTVLLRSDGTATAIGANWSGQTTIPALPDGVTYTDIAAGRDHTVLLRSDGTATAIGNNSSGQTTVPALPDGVTYTDIAAGGLHTVLLRSDGTATAIGDNYYGQTNIPALPPGTTYTDVAAGGTYTVLLRSDGTATAIGNNSSGQTNIPALPEEVAYSDIAAGFAHAVLLRDPITNRPTAVADTVTTTEDTPLVLAPNQLLANDTDPNNQPLSIIAALGASQGATAMAPDGTITYTPSANFSGTDSFTYVITNNKQADTATVTVTVTPVNDAPVAVNDTLTTAEDTPPLINVLANDTDVDTPQPSLTVAAFTQPTNGAVVLNPDNSFTYTPAANFNGADSFTYRVTDATDTSNPATVTVTITAVDDVPVAVDDTFTTAEDTVLTGNVLTNDTDIDTPHTDLRVWLASSPSHGQAVINGVDGSFTYTPAADFNGTDTFTYGVADTIADPTTSNPATVTVTVTAVNDAPVAGSPAFDVTATDPGTGTVTGTVNVSDVDADTLSYSVTSLPTGGTVTIDPDGTFSYDPTDAARLRAGLTPDTETDGFTVTVTDGHGGTTTVPVTGVAVSPAQLGVTATILTGTAPYDITFTADGSRAFVSTADTHTVQVVDTATNTVTDVLNIPTLSSNFISANDDGTLIYAGVDGGHSIGVIDSDPTSPTFQSVTDVIPVGSGVQGQVLSPDGSRLYVNNYNSGSVSVIDLESNTVIATVTVGRSPWDIAITPDGTRAFVVNTDSASVSVINTATNTVIKTIGVADRSHGVAVSANGARVYVANSNSNTVTAIDTATNTVIKTIGVDLFPSQVSSSPDGSLVYVAASSANAVTVIDTTTNTVIATVPVGRYPWGVTVGPSGDAYVSNLSAFPWNPTGGPSVSVISLVAMP